jgi:hypothetical protein
MKRSKDVEEKEKESKKIIKDSYCRRLDSIRRINMEK